MLKSITHIFLKSMCSANRSRPMQAIGRCVLPVFFLSLFLLIPPAFAELKPMGESELRSTTAQQGFTQFVMNGNTARLFLDIHMETYTTIGAFSAGYYDKGTEAEPSVGWDQQWDTVSIGNSEADDMTIDGLVLITDFDAENNLQRLVFGSNRLQGDLSAFFNSYTGAYNDAILVGGSGTGMTTLNRAAILNPTNSALPATLRFDSNADASKDMGMFFILNVNSPQQGVQVVAGYDEKSLTQGQWWDKP